MSLVAIGVAVVGLVVGVFLPVGDAADQVTKSITYEKVAPLVKDYLKLNGIADESGIITVPNTGTDEPSTVTVEEAIKGLIANGSFDYLKGEKGDAGATGATGAAGANGKDGATGAQGEQGEQGIPGAYAGKGDKGDTGATGATGAQGAKGDKGDKGDTGATGAAGQDGTQGIQGEKGEKGEKGDPGVIATTSGLTLAGGTLSLKPCAVDEVLMSNGSTWDCATVSASGVDTDTTNVSATLTLSGTSLEASITDSDGNTINAPAIDLGSTFATDLELSNAITTAVAGLNLSQYVTSQNLTDAIDALDIEDYAKTADVASTVNSAVSSAIAAATADLVSGDDLNSAIAALNLPQYATTADLTALTARVSTLETIAQDHEGRIAQSETDIVTIKGNYVTQTALTTALGNYYTKSETYAKSEVDTKLLDLETDIDSAKQNKLPTCADGEVIKYNTTTTAWECAADLNNVSGDGSNFATENWVANHVAAQNFATAAQLNTLEGKVTGNVTAISGLDTRVATLEGAGYVTTSTLTSTLASYLELADLSGEMLARLVAGNGVAISESSGTITITSTAQTDIFEVTSDHATIATPNSNKIYVDVGTTPSSEWVYENGAWVKVGEVNAEMTDYYTKGQTDAAIASAVAANNSSSGYVTTSQLQSKLDLKADQTALDQTNANLGTTNGNVAQAQQDITDLENSLSSNYTTTSVLTPMLAAKQDKLPTCGDGEVVKYVLATNSWACGADSDTTYDLSDNATKTWVTVQLSANNANYTSTTDLNILLNNKADKTALAATDAALAAETQNRQSGDNALDGRLDTIEADYVTGAELGTELTTRLSGYATTSQIADMATKTWVQGQNYLTEASADLAGYAKQSWVTGQGYVTSTTLNTTLQNYTTDTELATATSDMATNTGVSGTYVPKSALNCSSTQALVGTGTNGSVNCRAIQDISSGSLTKNSSLVTANTLVAVLGDYYTKTQIDAMLAKFVRGGSVDVRNLTDKTILGIAQTTTSPSEYVLYFASQLTDLPSDWGSAATGFLKIEMAGTGTIGVANNRRVTLSSAAGATYVRLTFDGYPGFWGGDWVRLDNGGDNYSISETITGKTWIDGKMIYRRVITGTTAATSGTTVAFSSAITGFGSLVSVGGYIVQGGSAGSMAAVPFAQGTVYANPSVASDGTVRFIHSHADGSFDSRPVTLIIEYTKN